MFNLHGIRVNRLQVVAEVEFQMDGLWERFHQEFVCLMQDLIQVHGLQLALLLPAENQKLLGQEGSPLHGLFHLHQIVLLRSVRSFFIMRS